VTDQAEFDDDRVAAVCRVLLDEGVEFLVIGGVAARLHDTGHATVDLDICPSSVDENLERLSRALRSLEARLRVEGEPHGVPFDPHPQQLRQMSTLTLLTVHGPVDLCFEPAGFDGGYRALEPGGVVVVVSGVSVPVAALEDVVTSKRSAGRPKDIVALPALEARLRQRGN
jgi:predicted nucleotidyltransferase